MLLLSLCNVYAIAPGSSTVRLSTRLSAARLPAVVCVDVSVQDQGVAQQENLYPTWPLNDKGKPELQPTLDTFEALAEVPLKAAKLTGDGWRTWSDGGFAGVKLVAAKLSRQTYPAVMGAMCGMLVQIQARYPDLYAVLKFVPKKNGLNPLLAKVQRGDLAATDINGLRPREVRRRLDDVQRSFEQCWLLVCSYLTLASPEIREDMLWAARTVAEKIKTDQVLLPGPSVPFTALPPSLPSRSSRPV